MDKQPILDQILSHLTDELESLAAAAKDAREYATDADSRAEDKYDTRALESSYLADGQGRLAAEVAENLEAYRTLVLREFPEGEPIALSALVELEQSGAKDLFFLGPKAGGLVVTCDGREVFVVTPLSPVGRRLLGQIAGAKITLDGGRDARITKVA